MIKTNKIIISSIVHTTPFLAYYPDFRFTSKHQK
jgi:hypothetical protein